MVTGGTREHLLVVLQHYAPTGSAQQECADFYGLLQREGLGKKEIDLQLVNALQDGLAHGNWPWSPVESGLEIGHLRREDKPGG